MVLYQSEKFLLEPEPRNRVLDGDDFLIGKVRIEEVLGDTALYGGPLFRKRS